MNMISRRGILERVWRTVGFFTAALLFFQVCSQAAWAVPSYHLVGWFNTFVPGGGEALRGNYLLGAAQAPLEVGTFLWGYNLSPQKPLTLDGVPQDLPVAQGSLKTTTSSQQVCAQTDSRTKKCTKYVTKTSSSTQSFYDSTPIDATAPAYAAILQEFGIKYHFINVFNSYRYTAQEQGGTEYEGQSIDMRSTGDLFLDPFQWETLSSPWVYLPLLAIAGFTMLDYRNQTVGGQQPALQPMTPGTNRLIGFNFIVWQPFGSGVPEEAFYRGFLQNEAYHVVSSPFFSIPLSTLAFTFSHAPSGRPTAAVAGGYLGFLAYKNQGNLSQGIAVHFWGVVILGLETYFLTKYAEGITPPLSVGTSISF